MAQTEKGIIYPYDYNEVADVPADLKALAESIDRILSDYSLNTDSGNKIVLEMNSTTYKIKAILKDKDDNVIDTSNEIDLPLENMVTNITYNNQKLTLTHQDGQTTEVSIADLISDLASKEEVAELQSQITDLETLVETELESNTVEGTEIDVSDSAEYRGRIEVKGNTEQEQLSGKNLLPNTVTSYTHQGIEYKTNVDGTITVNGTASAVSYVNIINGCTVTLPAGTYKLTGCPSGGSDSTYRLDIDNGSRVKEFGSGTTFTFSEETTLQNVRIRIASGTVVNNLVFKPMISLDGGDYEPYCGGQASPNPDYPQEIKVVTGDNVIKHCGKNLFNKDGTYRLGYIGTDGSFSSGNNTTCFDQYIPVTPNTAYTVSFNQAINALGCPVYYDTNKNFISRESTQYNVRSRTITTPANCYYMVIQFNVDNAAMTQAKINAVECMVEKSPVSTSYEPYRCEDYHLGLWKENEFNSTNATIYNALLNDAGFLASSDVNKTAIVSCQPNKTYKISKIAGKRLRVAEFNTSPSLGDAYTNRIKNDEVASLVFKTSGTANYLAITYYSTAVDTLTEQEILNSIQIQEAIELCKIGDYEDIQFKNEAVDENYNAELEDGAWYKKGVIGKQILNGTENWTTAINRNDYNKVAKQIQLQNAILNKGSISNLIVSQHFRSESADNIFGNNAIGINCAGISNTGYLRIGLELDKFPTDTSFKDYLSQNNDVLRFPVQTPTFEKITNTTLISQLEALRKAKWFKGVNHWWTETENLEPNLKGTYKQSNNLRIKEQDERLDNLESRLALLE